MATLPRAEDFASFHDIDPSSKDFRCIYYLVKLNRKCKHPINKTLRDDTSRLKQQILDELRPQARFELLLQFVENCGCRHDHQKLLAGSPLAKDICKRWERELHTISTGCQSSKDRQASTLTTTQDPQSEDNVRSSVLQNAPPSTTSRHPLRSKGPIVELQASSLNSEAETPVTTFEPMTKSNKTLLDVLLEPLSKREEHEFGDIYLFSKPSNPGQRKIGYSRIAESRLKSFEYTCGYKPILEHCVRNVPHMPRAERLTHYDLLTYRRRELNCICQKKHREWFECSRQKATGSIDNICRWMIEADPYGTDGRLKPQWVAITTKMQRNGQQVTSQSLIAALETMKAKSKATSSTLFDQSNSATSVELSGDSAVTATRGSSGSTASNLDPVMSTIVRDVLSLQPRQIAALQSILASLAAPSLVNDTHLYRSLPSTRLVSVA